MRFVLFCEGHTEHKVLPAFLKRWLDPKLTEPVGVQTVRFDGWAELVKDASTKAELYLTGPKSGDVLGVIGLIDLYGPTIYPGGVETIADRYKWMKQHVESKVNLPKFHMFCAVHEIEAWLLSDPQLLPSKVAAALPGKASKPETVNFSEPPAKLLHNLYRAKTRSGYKKVVHGSDLFSRLDPDQAHAKCPYFATLLDQMLQIAKAAGL